MPRALPVLTALIVVGVAGCGAGPDKGGPARAAQAFYSALGSGDGTAACVELAPEARHKLEQSGDGQCAEAVTSLNLSGETIRRIEVFGRGARVVLDSDTAFLAKFPDGWRITAAGCKERKERPYDCQVES